MRERLQLSLALARVQGSKLQKIRAKKNNKHKHFGQDGVWDKQELSLGDKRDPSLGQPGPVPGTNWPFSV